MLQVAELLAKADDLDLAAVFVSLVEEGVAIRKHLGFGRKLRIITMAPSSTNDAVDALKFDIEVFVSDLLWVQEVKQLLGNVSKLKGHVWVDSGFGRGGVMPQHALRLALGMKQHGMQIVGTGTHVPGGGSHETFTKVVETLKTAGVDPGTIHAANGYFSSSYPEDLVRVGGSILKNSFEWVTEVRIVKSLPKGHCVNYGCSWSAKRATMIAVLPVGYSEGYAFSLGNKGEAAKCAHAVHQ